MDTRRLRLVHASRLQIGHGPTPRIEAQTTMAFTRLWTIFNQRTPQQKEDLRQHREQAFRQWQTCIRLAWLQVELGGLFYIEQPQSCMSWRLTDAKTRYLLDQLSTYCIRDQCFDGLKHPKNGLPMQKGTRIQTNDIQFARQFAQRCTGHEYDHARIAGSVTRGTAFYPKMFCQRAIQLEKCRRHNAQKVP